MDGASTTATALRVVHRRVPVRDRGPGHRRADRAEGRTVSAWLVRGPEREGYGRDRPAARWDPQGHRGGGGRHRVPAAGVRRERLRPTDQGVGRARRPELAEHGAGRGRRAARDGRRAGRRRDRRSRTRVAGARGDGPASPLLGVQCHGGARVVGRRARSGAGIRCAALSAARSARARFGGVRDVGSGAPGSRPRRFGGSPRANFEPGRRIRSRRPET